MTEATGVQEAQASLQRSGLRLLTAIYAALQAVRLYPLENSTVQSSVEQLHRIATGLLEEEGSLEIRAVSGAFVLNLTRIRLTVAGHAVFAAFERYGEIAEAAWKERMASPDDEPLPAGKKVVGRHG